MPASSPPRQMASHDDGDRADRPATPLPFPTSRLEPPATTSDDVDADLLHRIATDDDDAALAQFYARYAGLVYSLAWRILRDEARAEDVLQETFIRIWRAAITFDAARGRPETWVVTIARNLALSALRKKRLTPLDDETAELLPATDENTDPEASAWRDTQRQIVREAVALLPENQRKVVLLAYFGGLTHVEIAARTGEPLGTVKSRLRLALRRLEGSLRATLGDASDAIIGTESTTELNQPEGAR